MPSSSDGLPAFVTRKRRDAFDGRLQPEAHLALVILSNELGPTTLSRLSVMANQIMTGIDARSVFKP